MGGVSFQDPLRGANGHNRYAFVRDTGKLGRIVTLRNPGADVWADAVDGVPVVLDSAQALTLSPDVMADPHAPGNWIISVQTILDDPLISPDYFAGNVVARVSWGNGGALFTAEFDAWGQIISIPADNVDVTIISESVGTGGAPVPGYWTRGYKTSVAAVRSIDSSPRLPTRSYPVQFFGGVGGVLRACPPFAVSGNFRANASPLAGTAPVSKLHYFGGPDLYVDPVVIETLSRMNQMIDIPQGCRLVEAVFPWDPNLRGALQFAIQL